MNDELNYAEMLEIPVETVTVNRKEKKRRFREPDLSEQVVEKVNDRMEEAGDPSYAESTPIARDEKPKSRREKLSRRIVLGEFVAVCALCAAIFFTNLFMPESAINTFVRGLFQGNAETADSRTYDEFTLASVVNEFEDVDISVSDAGVLSFTAKCSVYAPCEGTVSAVNGNSDSGYTVEIKHSDHFSTIVSGLNVVYTQEGEAIYKRVPFAYSKGDNAVHVMFYSDNTLLNCYTVNGSTISWS